MVGSFSRVRSSVHWPAWDCAVLPEHHVSPESKDVVKLGMGLIATLAALVLGLLIASAKSSFDAQRTGFQQLAANLVLLDRADPLRTRNKGRAGGSSPPGRLDDRAPLARRRFDGLRLGGLFNHGQWRKTHRSNSRPHAEERRTTLGPVSGLATHHGTCQKSLAHDRAKREHHPHAVSRRRRVLADDPLYEFWPVQPLELDRCRHPFGLRLSVAGAVFLIVDLDQHFGGLIQISSTPLRNALSQIGQS